jgi:prophage regulatory protein
VFVCGFFKIPQRTHTHMHSIPDTGFLRLAQIVGQKPITPEEAAINRATGRRNRTPRPGRPPIIPICESAWWRGVRSGRYPKPVKIGSSTLWRAEDIRLLIRRLGLQESA